ncbi:MAG: ABC transporter substrate-binding protein [Salinibacterium sp.]|nr:MAG: ABC transporter substrate-binding protein [Salinibacterium sp.]
MRTRYGIPLIAVATALALSGCVVNTAPTPTPTETAKVTVDKDAVALLPADIKAAGKLIVGVDATYPPNEFKNDNGDAIGWDVDLMDAVAAKLGLTTDYRIAKFDSIIPNVVGGRYDVGSSSFTDNKEREKVVDFVNYYTAGIQWASQKGKTVDPDHACGLKVAVQTGTVEDTDELPAKSLACTDAGKSAIQVLKYDGQDQATNAVALGQADAMSADSPITGYAIALQPTKLQAAGETFDVAPYGIAVGKGSSLADAIKLAFQDLVDDGTYKRILDKWGVADGAIDPITINAGANG